MKRKTMGMMVAVALLCLAGEACAQRNKNYYTQVVRLADSTEVRLLPDNIRRVNVIKDTDYEQMTALDYLRFGPLAGDSAAKFFDYWSVNYSNEDANVTLALPSNRVWVDEVKAMKPYLNYAANIKGVDLQKLSSVSDYTRQNSTFQCDPFAMPYTYLLQVVWQHSEEAIQRQQVLNGEVVVVDKLAKEWWWRELAVKDWSKNMIVTKTPFSYMSDSIIYDVKFEGIKCFNTYLDTMVVKTVAGTEFAVFAPAGNYAKPDVGIKLPAPLAATYNFYCVVVPQNKVYDDTASVAKPNPLNFSLYYSSDEGKLMTYNFSSNPDKQNPSTQNLTTAFLNDTTKVDTLFLGQFTFPVAYVGQYDVNPVLRITNPISAFNKTHREQYTRTLRLAAILMKPVELDNINE